MLFPFQNDSFKNYPLLDHLVRRIITIHSLKPELTVIKQTESFIYRQLKLTNNRAFTKSLSFMTYNSTFKINLW